MDGVKEVPRVKWGVPGKGAPVTAEYVTSVFVRINSYANTQDAFILHVSGPMYRHLNKLAETSNFKTRLFMSGNDVSRGVENHSVIIGVDEDSVSAYYNSI